MNAPHRPSINLACEVLVIVSMPHRLSDADGLVIWRQESTSCKGRCGVARSYSGSVTALALKQPLLLRTCLFAHFRSAVCTVRVNCSCRRITCRTVLRFWLQSGVMGSVALWFSQLIFYADEAPMDRFHSEQERAVPSIRNHACIGSALIIFTNSSAVAFVEKSFDHLFSSTR